MIEIEKDNKVKSTWAKALSQSDGDDKKVQSLYIKLRVATLIQERKKQIEVERIEIKEQEFLFKQEQEKLEQERLEPERIKRKIQQEINREKIIKQNKKVGIGIIIIAIIYFFIWLII